MRAKRVINTNKSLNESYQLSDFNGLEEAAAMFSTFKIIDVRRDPEYGYDNVYLMLIEFLEDEKIGLCIYDTEKQKFIEEPSDLDDYNTSPEDLYNKYRFIVPGYEELDEDAMGGVSSPGATLNNTPGIGNATPAATTDMTTMGSGDKWGDGDMYDQNGKIKKKKKKKKKKVDEIWDLNPLDHKKAFNILSKMHAEEDVDDEEQEWFDDMIDKNIFRKDNIVENNLNPYDKIGSMMAKKMGVAQPFKKGDSRTNTVKQETWEELDEDQPDNSRSIDDYVNNPDDVLDNAKKRKVLENKEEFKITTLDNYAKAAEHVPPHPLETRKDERKTVNEDAPREQESLKDIKAKNILKELGIPFIYKEGPSGKHRVFVKGMNINDVVKKLKKLGWEEVGTNPEKTIKKFHKDEKELAIFADGKNLPRVTVKDANETTNDMIESVLAKKIVSNSLEPYI